MIRKAMMMDRDHWTVLAASTISCLIAPLMVGQAVRRILWMFAEKITKPLAEVNDVYREPLTLELPHSETAVSIDSSISSGR